MGPCCLVVQKEEGLGWREDPGSGGAKHRFPASSPPFLPRLTLRQALPVYCCSKGGEDLLPSQEPTYAAFSFSGPVTLQLFVCVCLQQWFPNKRSHSLSSIPCWAPARWGRACHVLSRPLGAGIGAHTRTAVAPTAPPLTASRPRGQQEEVGFGEQRQRARGREEPGEDEGLRRVGWGSQCGHGWWTYGLPLVCAYHVLPYVSMIPPSHFLVPLPMDLLLKPTDFFPLFHGSSAFSRLSHLHRNKSKRSGASRSCLPF